MKNTQKYVKAPLCPSCRGVLLDMGKLPDELRIGICPYCMSVWLCEPLFAGDVFQKWDLMSFDLVIHALEKMTNCDLTMSH